MEDFEDKAEEDGLLPERDWELLEVIEKRSQEEVGVLERELSSFYFSLAVKSKRPHARYLGCVPCLVELTRRLFFLPVYPQKLPSGT